MNQKITAALSGVKPAINKQLDFVRDATRETVDYVKTGAADAHRDVTEGRAEEDRKVDAYGQPARPNVVYGLVKRAEQELGMGKGKGKGKEGVSGAVQSTQVGTQTTYAYAVSMMGQRRRRDAGQWLTDG